MSWKVEMPIIIRTLINDVGDIPKYSDQRLQQTIVVAAKYVQFDVELEQLYSLNVVDPEITPDPTVQNDDIFISLQPVL